MKISMIKENVLNYFAERRYTILNITGGQMSFAGGGTTQNPTIGFVMRGGHIIFIDIVSSLAEVKDGVSSYREAQKKRTVMGKAGVEYHAVTAKNLGTAITKITDILSDHNDRRSIGGIGRGAADSVVSYNV